MKVGIRTPNITKSIKARTTGKVKRAVKSSINPVYGKKGMGLINDPEKAIYNKVYNKTTTSFVDLIIPNKKDNLIVTIFKLIIYLYYLVFKYLFYVPIKFIIEFIINKNNETKQQN